MRSFNISILEKAFTRLGELAESEGVTLEICIYGGALMMLAYNSRIATKDVDAIFYPREKGLALAAKVATEFQLPENWLNDDVKLFIAPNEHLRKLPKQFKGLQITAPTAGYLLAMKALSCRSSLPGTEGDISDLRFLIKKLQIHSLQEIQHQIDKYYPDDTVLPQHKLILEALLQEQKS